MAIRTALLCGAAFAAAACATETTQQAAAPAATVTVASAASAAAPARPSASLAVPADAPPPKPQPPGPYRVDVISEASLASHTVYRPSDLSAFGASKKLPIIAWGNGACSNAGLLFQTFLVQVASHGYVAIASGPKDAPLPAFAQQRPGQVTTAPNPNSGIKSAQTKDADMKTAIDWAIAENARQGSPYFGKLDTNAIAVMGQSCGGLQATANSGDPRVKTVVIWNSGVFNAGAPTGMSGASKDMVPKFHAPVAYFLGGPSDVAYPNGKDDFARVTNVPAFLGSINSGHGGTFNHPGAGWFGEVGVAWLDWQLKGDKAAASYFEGADCKLCKNPIWEVAKKNMK